VKVTLVIQKVILQVIADADVCVYWRGPPGSAGSARCCSCHWRRLHGAECMLFCPCSPPLLHWPPTTSPPPGDLKQRREGGGMIWGTFNSRPVHFTMNHLGRGQLGTWKHMESFKHAPGSIFHIFFTKSFFHMACLFCHFILSFTLYTRHLIYSSTSWERVPSSVAIHFFIYTFIFSFFPF